MKKARLEVATDNISVSSESIQSIEDNDDSDLEQNTVPDLEIVVEKKQEIEPYEEISEGLPDIIDDDSENVKDIIEKPDVLQIQEEIIIDEIAVKQSKNKIQGYEIDSTDGINIYEANTQMPSIIMDADERSPSVEVVYDFPNTGKENVPILGKLEDENLPSTNDTDDIQITCGQVVKNSQEVDGRKCVDENVATSKVNGVNSPEKELTNGDIPEGTKEIASKVPNNNDLTVEDMLADFVDEVKDDTQATQA